MDTIDKKAMLHFLNTRLEILNGIINDYTPANTIDSSVATSAVSSYIGKRDFCLELIEKINSNAIH